MPTPRVRRTLLVVSAAVAALVLVALVIVNLQLFVRPSTDEVGHADAVVVLAGGDGERLDHGLELMSDGVAPTLVASTGPNRLCNADPDRSYEVICFLPDPSNTRGEVEEIADLAREHGWERLVLVTSTYHATPRRAAARPLLPGHGHGVTGDSAQEHARLAVPRSPTSGAASPRPRSNATARSTPEEILDLVAEVEVARIAGDAGVVTGTERHVDVGDHPPRVRREHDHA